MTNSDPDSGPKSALLSRLAARLGSRPDSEHEQALIRVVFGVIILGFCLYRPRFQGLHGFQNQFGAFCHQFIV